MKKKSKTIIFLTVAILVVVTMLLGCTGTTPSPTTTQTTTATTTATTTPTTTTATTSPTQQQAYTLRAQHIGLPASSIDIIGKRYAALVDTMSQGRLKVTWTGSGSLVPDTEIATAVGKGTLDMGEIYAGYITGILPVANFNVGYPGQFRNAEDVIRYQKMGFVDIMDRAYASIANVKVIGALVIDAALPVFMMKDAPRLANIQGMKIRLSGALGTVLGKLGASVVTTPGGEIYTALTTKVIDGAGYGDWGLAASIGIADIAPYVIDGLVGARQGGDFLINKDKWNSLPKDLQEILSMSLKVWAYEGGYTNEDPALTKVPTQQVKINFAAKGGKVIIWPKEDMDKITEITLGIMQEAAAKDKYCAEAMALFQDMLKRR